MSRNSLPMYSEKYKAFKNKKSDKRSQAILAKKEISEQMIA